MEKLNSILLLCGAFIKMMYATAKKGRLWKREGKAATVTAFAAMVAAVAITLAVVYFVKPPITGYATASASLYVTGIIFPYNCSLSLTAGWNLISIPCSADDAGVSSVLANISGSYSAIHSFDATDLQDHWKSYNPNLPGWVEQDITAINTTKGYWIRALRNTTLNVTGTIHLPSTVRLEQGWNLVGYPTNDSRAPSELFLQINSSISSVHAYNASDSSDQWKAYSPGISQSLNDLSVMAPYWGYWINTSQAANWRIQLMG